MGLVKCTNIHGNPLLKKRVAGFARLFCSMGLEDRAICVLIGKTLGSRSKL